MAAKLANDLDPRSGHVTLSSPTGHVGTMFIFVAGAAFIAMILFEDLRGAFMSNPALNGLILFVFVVGIIFSFVQVLRLFPEIRWVNRFRIADPGLAVSRPPNLLAPMANMMRERQGTLSLSTEATRSMMDTIGSRLDESRETGRYLVGLLIFLGLLGTFWGLLGTINSVGATISSLDPTGTNSVNIFEDLKRGLAAPLSGMGTAFSSSLFGLAGSLILGFLELRASQAQNRFYNELEEWLSAITEIGTAGPQVAQGAQSQLQFALVDMQRSMVDLGDRLEASVAKLGTAGANDGDESVKELARGIEKLVRQMRAEQKIVREWVDEQAAQQSDVAQVLKLLNAKLGDK